MERNSKTSDKNSIKTALIYSYKFLNKKERFQLKRNVTLSFFAGIFEIISIQLNSRRHIMKSINFTLKSSDLS